MAEYVINLLGNICELFIILFFLKDNYKPRVKKAVFIPLCVVFTLFQFVNTNLFLAESVLVVIFSLAFTFAVTLLFKLKMWQNIIYTAFIYLILALSEVSLGMILSLGFNIGISDTQSSSLLFAIGTLSSKFFAYVFILFTKAKRFQIKDKLFKHNVLWVFLLPIASILIMLLFLRCCYQIEDTGFQVITLITSVILAFANIAIFYIIDKQNELIETKEKLLFTEKHINNQVIHYQDLYKYQNEMRIFRHDIRNRLVSLIGLLKQSQTDKAIQEMESNLNWINEMNDNIVNSGNPVIDAILQSKLRDAKQKGISIEIFIRFSADVEIDEIELGIILGNALDNAIEAVEKIADGENKTIQFKLISTKDRISISIENPVKDNVDVNNLSTTKVNKIFHGYGVERIKQIARKYDGFANFTCENSIFTTNINMANIKAKR